VGPGRYINIKYSYFDGVYAQPYSIRDFIKSEILASYLLLSFNWNGEFALWYNDVYHAILYKRL